MGDSLNHAQDVCLYLTECVVVFRQIFTGSTNFCRSFTHVESRLSPGLIVWEKAALVSTCQLYVAKQLFLEEDRLDATPCKGLGVSDFKIQSQPLPCRPSRQTVTPSLQLAAIDCLEDPSCDHFAREGDTGKTVFCFNHSEVAKGVRGTDSLIVEEYSAWKRNVDGSWVFGLLSNSSSSQNTSHSTLLSQDVVSIDSHQMRASVTSDFSIIGGNAECGKYSVITEGVTYSFNHAMYLCRASPHCTVVTRSSRTGATKLCQSYARLKYETQGAPFETALRRGCEFYWHKLAHEDIVSFRPPRCFGQRHSCAAALHRLPVYTRSLEGLPRRVLCDECGNREGVCPVLIERVRYPGLDELSDDIQKQTQHLMENPRRKHKKTRRTYGGTNPSIFVHNGQYYLVYRATDCTRCSSQSADGDWVPDNGYHYHSRIGFCTLQQRAQCEFCGLQVRNCVLIENLGVTYQIRGLHAPIDTIGHLGQEDPRAFSLKGELFILCNIGIRHENLTMRVATTLGPSIQVRRIVLVKITPDGSVLDAVRVRIPLSEVSVDVKNAVPLVSPDGERVYIIHAFVPYQICELDTVSGACTELPELAEKQQTWQPDLLSAGVKRALLQNGGLSGGTGFVRISRGFLGLVHRKQHLELGRLYHHKWLLLSLEPPHLPVWASASFRLPFSRQEELVSDIQFAAGILVNEATGKVLVSYGIADCLSWFAVLDLPAFLLPNATGSVEPLPPFQLIQPLPYEEGPLPGSRPIRLRWEGPITTSEGFAFASRSLLKRLVEDDNFELQIRETMFNRKPFESEKHSQIYSRIIRSHWDLAYAPDITVRMHWDPNLQPAPAGLLVVYLPWEFETLPDQWVQQLNAHADEVWATSEHVRQGFIRCGVKADKVHILHHGAPDEICNLQSTALPMPASHAVGRPKTVRLLYHGGLLWRKGIDLLLKAYFETFTGRDDVLLIIHSSYGDDDVKAYMHNYLKRMEKTSFFAGNKQQNRPKYELSLGLLSSQEKFELLRSANAVVHPSRSEGFGMGIVEAMAHGVPVVMSDYGPQTEFVDNSSGFFFHGQSTPCDLWPCHNNSQAVFNDYWVSQHPYMWGSYNASSLGEVLRYVYDNPAEITRRGMNAKRICERLSWKDMFSTMKARLLQLTKKGQWGNGG
ncbi:hypothetical protein CYMTET_46100 [Cymbomonas tetramitiformis]|uniref:Glycosyl transferase family 1 domain-containing protein n=1 Tax=Cymbomonas tetramitiformis TaxID=36881 RepID=A0AAE0BYP5_9CHLO|nr:hypothetical protein CYMTET_46100 [Cymbomonas tetramitiformis]